MRQNYKNIAFILLGINIAVFFFANIIPSLLRYTALYPSGLLGGMVWTPVTYMFVHRGFSHLLFSMLFLAFVGPNVETRMGSREFLAFYLITGTLAGLFSTFAYMTRGFYVPIMGASGALYGVMLAFATYFPQARLLIFFILPIRAPIALALFTASDILLNLRGEGSVVYLTRLSGLLFGMLYFLIRLNINPIKAMRDR